MADASPSEVVAALHGFGMSRDRFRAAMTTAVGLGLSDVDALEYLERGGPMTQRDLGAQLELTSGAVTMLVDRLVDRGLVRRTPHPTDRRATLVELAPKAALPDVTEIDDYHRVVQSAARRLNAADRATVIAFLRAATEASAAGAAGMRARPPSSR